jgi:hypothetical protein
MVVTSRTTDTQSAEAGTSLNAVAATETLRVPEKIGDVVGIL